MIAFLRRDSDGGALVEAALVLPAYLLLVTGMVSTVMAISSYQQLGIATATAAQVVGAARGQTDPCALVVTTVTNSLPGWVASNFTYTVVITQSVKVGSTTTTTPEPFGPTTGSSFSCSGSNTQPGTGGYALYFAQGNPVAVIVVYKYTWFPIYSNAITAGNLQVKETMIVD